MMSSQIVIDILENLRDENGFLHIEDVVKEAADPASPLHQHFTWDDVKASHRYRLGEARTLIRAQKVPFRLGPIIVRSVSYVPTPNQIGTYQKLADVEPASDVARAMVLNELSRVSGALARARNIAVILGLSDEIDDLLNALTVVQEKASKAPPANADA
jgi:hypothetical protein